MSTLSVGTIIFDDGFEIISILSRDDIGIIYLAKDTQLNTSVAIKEYFPSDLAVRDGNRVGPKNSSCAMDYPTFRAYQNTFLELNNHCFFAVI